MNFESKFFKVRKIVHTSQIVHTCTYNRNQWEKWRVRSWTQHCTLMSRYINLQFEIVESQRNDSACWSCNWQFSSVRNNITIDCVDRVRFLGCCWGRVTFVECLSARSPLPTLCPRRREETRLERSWNERGASSADIKVVKRGSGFVNHALVKVRKREVLQTRDSCICVFTCIRRDPPVVFTILASLRVASFCDFPE